MPDGYTLLFSSNETLVQASVIRPKYAVDLRKDVVPVSLVARAPLALVVPTNSRIRSTQDLIAEARANPGMLKFATASQFDSTRFATELLQQSANLKVTVVPYKGTGPALAGLVGGQVNSAFLSLSVADAAATDNKLRIIGITTPSIVPGARDYPVLSQQGLPDLNVEQWLGLLAPGGTSAKIIDDISHDVKLVLDHVPKEVTDTFARLKFARSALPAKDFTALLFRDSKRWASVVRTVGIKAD